MSSRGHSTTSLPSAGVEPSTTPQPQSEDVNGSEPNLSRPPLHGGANHVPHSRQADRGAQHRSKKGLQWYKDHLSINKRFANGRVLIIEFFSPEHQTVPANKASKTLKVSTQEIDNLAALSTYFKGLKSLKERKELMASLRIFHVQNAPWAVASLQEKFNIEPESSARKSPKWAKITARPSTGRPRFNATAWVAKFDPWRGVRSSAFSLDYIRYEDRDSQIDREDDEQDMSESEDEFPPDHRPIVQDTSFSTLSIYMQRKYGDGGKVEPPQGSTPEEALAFKAKLPDLELVDNETALLIFDSSASGSLDRCLVPPRQEIETRWRRLAFYLPALSLHPGQWIAAAGPEIVGDVFGALGASWQEYTSICEQYVSQLEDAVYSSPSDDSHAPELWINNAFWVKIEKLIYSHMYVLAEVKQRVVEVMGSNDNFSFDQITNNFDRVASVLAEDVVKPTTAMTGVIYQAVAFRDSRMSLELNTSIWRLSWITFIFLPLTFLGTFFGMNVDTFHNDPSLKWYFITAIPFMITILVLYLAIKYLMGAREISPWQRGIYKSVWRDLARQYPKVWSESGPRPRVIPPGFFARIKWRIIASWFAPDKVARPMTERRNLRNEGLNFWARVKLRILERWLAQLPSDTSKSPSNIELGKMKRR